MTVPSVPQTKPLGALWPLGSVVVTTAGTPVPLTLNVGSQKATGGSPPGRPFTAMARGLTLCAPSGNAGDIYLNYGNVAGLDVNATMLVLPPGTVTSLPNGHGLQESQMDLTAFWVDCQTSGGQLVVLATDAS